MDPLPEECGSVNLPILECGYGRSALQSQLWKLVVVDVEVAQEGLFQIFTAVNVMALQDIPDPASEPFDHAVRLRPR